MKYYPQKPIDWTTKLAEIYARQSKQLEEHHNNLRARDQQMVAKAQSEDLTKVLASVAQFSSSARQLSSAFKSSRFKKRKREYDDMSPELKEARKIKFNVDFSEVQNKDAAILKQLKEQGLPTKLLDEVQKLSPSEIARHKIFFTKDAINAATPSAFLAAMGSGGDVELKKRYDSFAGNDQAQADVYRKWIDEQIEHLNPGSGSYAANIHDEVERMVSTFSGTADSKAKSNLTTSKKVTFTSTLPTNLKIGSDPFQAQMDFVSEVQTRALKFNDIPNGKTALQQATESVVGDLYQMGVNEELNRDMLTQLFTKTDALKDHPAGKTIDKAFFDKDGEMYNFILEGVEKGEAASFGRLQDGAETKYQQTYTDIYKGKLTDKTEIDRAIADLSVLPLKNKDKKLEDLEALRNFDQSEVATKRILEEYQPYITDGNLDEKLEEIKLIQNVTARNKLLEIAESYKDFKDKNNWSQNLTAWANKIETARTGESLGKGPQTPWGERVAADVKLYAERDLAQRIALNPKSTTIMEENLLATTAYWESNGGGKTGPNETGKFAVTGIGGKYSNYEKFVGIQLRTDDEHDVPYTTVRGKTWEKNNNAIRSSKAYSNRDGTYNKKKRYNTPGAIFSNDMIAGTLQNGEFSDEMIHLAKLEGEPVSKLFGFAIDALVNSNDEADKSFAGLLNLDKVNTKDQPDQRLADMLDGAFKSYDDLNVQAYSVRDLTYLLRYKGWGDLTTKQRNRIYLTLTATSDISDQYSIDQQAAVKEKKKPETQDEPLTPPLRGIEATGDIIGDFNEKATTTLG